MDWEQFLSGLLGAAGQNYLYNVADQGLEDAFNDYSGLIGDMQGSLADATNFTPFTITGTGGNTALSGADGRFGGLDFNVTDPLVGVAQGAAAQAAANSVAPTSPTLPTIGEFSGNYYGGVTAPTIGTAPSIPLGGASSVGALPGAINTQLQQAGLFNPNVQAAQFGQGAVQSGLAGTTSAGDIIGNLGIGTGRSEGDIYQMLESMQQPDRERERLQLRDELASQGRLGLQTAQYGGSPEELARAKAVEEARSSNAFRAFQLAGEEQNRLANQRLSAYGIGEQSAARGDQGLLQSFGLADRSSQTANQLTNILGGLGLQGQQQGNQFTLGLLDASLGQRGQDVNYALQSGALQDRFGIDRYNAAVDAFRAQSGADLGLFDAQLRDRQLAAQYGLSVDELNLARQSQMANQNLNLFGTQVQSALGQGGLASQFYSDSFLPQRYLMEQMGLARDFYDIDTRAALQSQGLLAGLNESLLEATANTQMEQLRAQTDYNNTLANLFLGQQNAEGDIYGGLFNTILNGLFGGDADATQQQPVNGSTGGLYGFEL